MLQVDDHQKLYNWKLYGQLKIIGELEAEKMYIIELLQDRAPGLGIKSFHATSSPICEILCVGTMDTFNQFKTSLLDDKLLNRLAKVMKFRLV